MKKLCCLLLPVCLLYAGRLSAQNCSVTISTDKNTKVLDCRVTRLILTADTTGTSGTVNFQWSTGATNVQSIEITEPGVYSVSITDGVECTSSFSITITQDITKPDVSVSPVPSGKICKGATVFLSASGADSYSWKSDPPDKLFPNESIIKATPLKTTTYTVSGTAASNGCSKDAGVEVQVQEELPAASLSGLDAVCQNASNFITFSASGGEPPYIFTFHIDNGDTQKAITRSTEHSTSVIIPTSTVGTMTYILESVAEKSGCIQSQIDNNKKRIEVVRRVSFESSKTEYICNNKPFTYTAKSSAGKDQTTFYWTRPAIDGIEVNGKNNEQGEEKSESITETLKNTTKKPIVVTYIFKLTTTVGCEVTDTLKVTVYPTPLINGIGAGNYCNGEPVSGIPFSSPADDATFKTSFRWTSDTSVGFGTKGNGPIPVFTASNPNKEKPLTATVLVYPLVGDGCEGDPTLFTVTVRSGAVLEGDKTKNICNNKPFTYTAESSAGNNQTIFHWTRPAIDGIEVKGKNNEAGEGESASITETLSNITKKPIVVKYLFDFYTNTGCVKTSDIVQVTVYPTPLINGIGAGNYCNGEPVSGIPFSSPADDATFKTSFRWTSDNYVGFDTKGNGPIPGFKASNPNKEKPLTATVLVYPLVGDGCEGDPTQFTVTVPPAAVLKNDKTRNICDNALVSDTALSSSLTTARYRWTRQAVADIISDGSSNQGEKVINERLHNTSSKSIDVTYTFELYENDKCSTTDTLKVTVYPTPSIATVSSKNYCNGDSTDAISFSGSFPNPSFDWISSIDIGRGTRGTGTIPRFATVNKTDSTLLAKFAVAIRIGDNACLGKDSAHFTMTVFPSPAAPDFTSLKGSLNNTPLVLCDSSENINFNIKASTKWGKDQAFIWTCEDLSGHRVSKNDVLIKDTVNPNTVISFRNPGSNTATYIIKLVSSTDSTHSVCKAAAEQKIEVKSKGTGIPKQRVYQLPGKNLLFYPDNSLPSYQWGYDAVINASSTPQIYSRSIPVEGQVYQYFAPDTVFIKNKKLDTTNYKYWVLLEKASCATRVYYNGIYSNRLMAPMPVSDTVRMQIFANPNNGVFTVSLQGKMYGTIRADIRNASGQVVFSKEFIKTIPVVSENFNTANLPGGVYYLTLRSSDLKTVVSRFVIQH